MSLESEHEAILLVATQRCFYLFTALLLLIVAVPFLEDTPRGLITLNLINVFILLAALAAVSRSRLCLVSGGLLAAAVVTFQILFFIHDEPRYLFYTRGFGVAFYFVATSYLLGYVLRRDTFTVDKLYGAAAAYLMIGILWTYLYTILLMVYPGALSNAGAPMTSYRTSDVIYFSFTVLTSTGFGDMAPVHPVARMTCALEQIAGVLFIAILIARLASTYPPSPSPHKD